MGSDSKGSICDTLAYTLSESSAKTTDDKKPLREHSATRRKRLRRNDGPNRRYRLAQIPYRRETVWLQSAVYGTLNLDLSRKVPPLRSAFAIFS